MSEVGLMLSHWDTSGVVALLLLPMKRIPLASCTTLIHPDIDDRLFPEQRPNIAMDETKLRQLERQYKLRVKTGCETCR